MVLAHVSGALILKTLRTLALGGMKLDGKDQLIDNESKFILNIETYTRIGI